MTDTACEAYLEGYLHGVEAFAWYRDGEVLVGALPTARSLKAVLARSRRGNGPLMEPEVRKYLRRKAKAKNS